MSLAYLDRPIAFHSVFVDLGVGVTGALMLSQAVYWHHRTKDPEGWFYKTQAEWQDETGLKRTEQERARRALKSIGVLEERKKGIPARLFYRLNEQVLLDALNNKVAVPSLDDVLTNYKANLKHLSKSGLMRATKVGVATEYVDYAEVLKEKGLVCGCCGKAINMGPAKHPEGLSFDHVIPLAKGGSHTKKNLQPAHFGCNSAKLDSLPEEQQTAEQSSLLSVNKQANLEASAAETTKDAYPKQTGVLTQSKQACLPKADRRAYPKQTNTETTQRLPETTTKKIKGSRLGVLPDGLCEKVWIDWLAYKRRIRKSYKTENGEAVKAVELVELSGGCVQKQRQIMQQSINNEWAGFFALKSNTASSKQSGEMFDRMGASDGDYAPPEGY